MLAKMDQGSFAPLRMTTFSRWHGHGFWSLAGQAPLSKTASAPRCARPTIPSARSFLQRVIQRLLEFETLHLRGERRIVQRLD